MSVLVIHARKGFRDRSKSLGTLFTGCPAEP